MIAIIPVPYNVLLILYEIEILYKIDAKLF